MKLENLVPILSETQIFYLIENDIINWIWIKWENLDYVVLEIIRTTYRFDENKSFQLLWDIKQLAFYHDIMYFYRFWFYYSNLWFAYKVYKLIDWDIWYRRILVFITILFILNKYWKISYKK